jgi:hypothetical protein
MRVLSNSGRFRVASQQFKLFVLFAIAFCAAAQYFRIVASPDPSSFFVDIKRVYERRYSTIRIEEAGEFIARSGNSKDESKASSNPSICVGIATVQRDDAKYFNLLVSSPSKVYLMLSGETSYSYLSSPTSILVHTMHSTSHGYLISPTKS